MGFDSGYTEWCFSDFKARALRSEEVPTTPAPLIIL